MPESPSLLVPVGAELMAVAQRRWTPPGYGARVEGFSGPVAQDFPEILTLPSENL